MKNGWIKIIDMKDFSASMSAYCQAINNKDRKKAKEIEKAFFARETKRQLLPPNPTEDA